MPGDCPKGGYHNWVNIHETATHVTHRCTKCQMRQVQGHDHPAEGKGGHAMRKTEIEIPAVLTPGEVARVLRVDPKTITRWARNGKLPSFRTLGGHRRYFESDVNAILRRRP